MEGRGPGTAATFSDIKKRGFVCIYYFFVVTLKRCVDSKSSGGHANLFFRKLQILKFLLNSPKNPLFRGGLLLLN
jgi:hypothetical protein